MQTERHVTVTLDYEEARTVRHVLPFHRIGLPDADTPDSDDERLRKAIRHIAGDDGGNKPQAANREQIERASIGVRHILEAAERESDPAYWQQAAAALDAGVPTKGGGMIVFPSVEHADHPLGGEHAITAVLVEARQQQAELCRAALMVLDIAYGAAA